jgi:hypothetical protein
MEPDGLQKVSVLEERRVLVMMQQRCLIYWNFLPYLYAVQWVLVWHYCQLPQQTPLPPFARMTVQYCHRIQETRQVTPRQVCYVICHVWVFGVEIPLEEEEEESLRE